MSILTSIFSLLFLSSSSTVIDGYINRLSARPGDSVTLYLNASHVSKAQEIKLFDLQGNIVASIKTDVFPQTVKKDKPWENGFGYKATAKIKTPQLKSGVYLWEGSIPFIVKATHPKVLILYSSNTETAYCNAGGKSLYGFNSSEQKMASKVSFMRPVPMPKHSTDFLHWIQKQNIGDVGYITDRDMDDYNEIRKSKLLIIPGHSEYWTVQARQNFDRFVDDGRDALILSGNTMWWQVRYENDKLVCYRFADLDPVKENKSKTINWNELALEYPILNSIGVDFSLAGFGLMNDKGWNGYRISNGKSPLLEGTNLKDGDILPLPSDEYDGTLVTGFGGLYKPIVNRAALGFEKLQIIGYDSTFRLGQQLMATWIVMKKSHSSGIIINTSSTDWCSSRGMNNDNVRIITLNMINKLLRKENVFAPEEEFKPTY